MYTATISVVVTGAPPNFCKPKTLPGETIEQFTIRTHPQHWQNCIERLERKLSLTKKTCDRLRCGEIEGHEAKVRSEIHEFMRWRRPQSGRTYDSLAEVRDVLTKPPLTTLAETQTRIIQILSPKVHCASNDEQHILICKEYGVETIWLELQDRESYFVQKVLPKVSGEFVWIVPVLTRCSGPMTALRLTEIMTCFSTSPMLALFSDQTYTNIYRVEAIRNVLKRGLNWPNDGREQARILHEFGYEFWAHKVLLVALEELYGGYPKEHTIADESTPTKNEKRSWRSRIFGE
jgi:hypothetical protein